jgi:hypothetical protein
MTTALSTVAVTLQLPFVGPKAPATPHARSGTPLEKRGEKKSRPHFGAGLETPVRETS